MLMWEPLRRGLVGGFTCSRTKQPLKRWYAWMSRRCAGADAEGSVGLVLGSRLESSREPGEREKFG